MIESLFTDQSWQVLERAVQASGLRHEVIAHNLANVNTPGFKRSEVLFQEKLAAALAARRNEFGQLRMARTDARHFGQSRAGNPENVEPEVVTRAETTLRGDGNNVDLDSEIVKLSQNQLLYRSLTQIMKMKLSQLRTAINEGRR